jgi:hypothetical protein
MSPLDGPFSPFSALQIKEIESTLGRALPRDYVEFVTKYGGAFVGGSIDGKDDFPVLSFFAGDEIRGVLSMLTLYPDLRDAGVLPIADCELGNLYVLDRENRISYLNYYGGVTTARKVALSFTEFIGRIVIEDE